MKARSQALEVATLREFDLVVIGGGIIGAGVAQDAVSRGLSVLLLDKDDFGSGTSSKTTKLIHGGLRYLEHLRLGLTRQHLEERSLLEQLAPHLVRDFSFILPLIRGQWLFSAKASAGLTLYDLLSWNLHGVQPHRRVSQKEVLEHAPALLADKVVGGLRFHDCITDDARLVMEVIKSACLEGAHAINYVEVRGFEQENQQVRLLQCRDRYSGTELTVRCLTCVNATGVWSDQLLKLADPQWKDQVEPVKGVHIMVPPSAFETNTALVLPGPFKRYIFVVPFQRALMIGTAETPYTGDFDRPMASADEVDYLLQVINSYTGNSVQRSDVIAAWAGLRPLLDEPSIAAHSNGQMQANTANAFPQHRIFFGPGGIISVLGGKLTNYRLIAGDVVNRVVALKGAPAAEIIQSRTKRIMLGGWGDKNGYLALTAALSAKARKLAIEPATLDHLIASYGKDAEMVIDLVEQDSSLNERICPDFPPIMAEIPHCVLNEMAVSLEDLLFRRMRLAIIHQKQCLEAAPKVARLMQKMLGWDQSRTDLELAALERTLIEHIDCFAPAAVTRT